jgi:hypothetical protein
MPRFTTNLGSEFIIPRQRDNFFDGPIKGGGNIGDTNNDSSGFTAYRQRAMLSATNNSLNFIKKKGKSR